MLRDRTGYILKCTVKLPTADLLLKKASMVHGVRREKKLAALGKDLNVAADITKLLGHGVYRLSYLV